MLKNLNPGSKLIAGFLAVAAIAGIIGFLGIDNMDSTNKMLNSIYVNNLVPITDAANANMQAINHNRTVYDYIIEPSRSEMAQIELTMNDYEKK